MLLRLSQGSPEYVFFSAAIWNSSLIEKLTLDLHGLPAFLPGRHWRTAGFGTGGAAQPLSIQDNCTVVLGEIEAWSPDSTMICNAVACNPRYRDHFFRWRTGLLRTRIGQTDFAESSAKTDISTMKAAKAVLLAVPTACPLRKRGYIIKILATVEKRAERYSQPPTEGGSVSSTGPLMMCRTGLWPYGRFLGTRVARPSFILRWLQIALPKKCLTFWRRLHPGVFSLNLGIQSTNERTLEAVNRQVDPVEAHRTISRLAGLGNIHLHVDLILGLPFETRESFSTSFADIFAMGAHYIQMGLLKILPDTPICHECQ